MIVLRRILAGFCTLAALGILLGVGLPDRARVNAVFPLAPGDTPIAPEINADAPPIDGIDISGQHFTLSSMRGNPVIINFWATWCGPCEAEAAELDAVQAENPRVHIVGINYGEDRATILSWIRDRGVRYRIVPDPELRWVRLYQVRGLPTSFVLDGNGLITHIILGPVTRDQITGLIR